MSSETPIQTFIFTIQDSISHLIRKARDEVIGDMTTEERMNNIGDETYINVFIVGNKRHLSRHHIDTFKCFKELYSFPIYWLITSLSITKSNGIVLNLLFTLGSKTKYDALFKTIKAFLLFNGLKVYDDINIDDLYTQKIPLACAKDSDHAQILLESFTKNKYIQNLMYKEVASVDFALYQEDGTVVETFVSGASY